MIGGKKDFSLNSIASDDVKQYNKETGWSDYVTLPERVDGAQSIVIRDRIYVLGSFHNFFFLEKVFYLRFFLFKNFPFKSFFLFKFKISLKFSFL